MIIRYSGYQVIEMSILKVNFNSSKQRDFKIFRIPKTTRIKSKTNLRIEI